MKKIIFGLLLVHFISCNKNDEKADGYGNFEATEVTVSAESNGKIEFLNVEEGMTLERGATVGLIDTLQLYYSKKQLQANQVTIGSKTESIESQAKVFQEQLKTAQTERSRIRAMYAENAATKRQVDEADGRVNVILEQIKSVHTQKSPISNEIKSNVVQIQKLNDQITKSKILNPIAGTVLTKYAEPGEITAFGKPLYKIGDLSEMTLRVYVSAKQLPQLKMGQTVYVKIDGTDAMKTYKGTVAYIASQAEFTPKVIQTKEERVNLVYAVKVRVKNDGTLKIGMPGEMWLHQE